MKQSHGSSREALFARIHAALGRNRTLAPAAPPSAIDESIARLASTKDDLVTMFCERAAVVGMNVQRLPAADLTRTIVQILKNEQATRVMTSVGSVAQAAGLNESLRRASFEVIDWRSSVNMDLQFDTHAGITDVHAALAESGTLICNSGSGHSRGLSLIPPIHIAIVRPSNILPDMIDYWKKFRGMANTSLPSSMAFITGPSKTADIEGVLITGVHGPGKVFILIVEDA